MADDKNKTVEESLKELKASIDKEKAEQYRQRETLKKYTEEIRELRKERAKISAEEADYVTRIRKQQELIAQRREIVSNVGGQYSEDEVENARQEIAAKKTLIQGHRYSLAQEAKKSSVYREQITSKIGEREQVESELSMSRAQQREILDKQRRYDSAQGMTTRSLRGELSKQLSPDSELEALKFKSSIGKAGGTKAEQQQAQQVSMEFSALSSSVKELRKALALLSEGSEEYNAKREELTTAESKATDVLGKMTKLETDVEKRRLMGGQPGMGSRIAGGVGMAMSAYGQFGGQAIDRMGALATERYVMEESRKQAQLQLKGMALQDARSRTRDATAFLATGAGSLFGAETPYDRAGNTNKSIQRLGEDYATTTRGVAQQAVVMRGVERLGNAVTNTAAGAQGGLTGVAASGAANFGGALLGIGSDVSLSPDMGSEVVGKTMIDINNSVIDATSGLASSGVGRLANWMDGNEEGAKLGVGKIGSGLKKATNAMPLVMQRAGQAADERLGLINAEQQQAQVGRIRERLGLAFAPAMQQYMDMQGSQEATLRSRSMDRTDRENYERQLEAFSLDRDLGDRGFGAADILKGVSSAAQGFGRFGAGGMNEKVAKSAMMAQAAGLGSAEQNIQAMTKMKAAGVDDPEAVFTRAVKEGLQRGLQDSRQFQELLNSAAATSDGVGNFEGTIKSLLEFGGSGRANDVTTMTAGMKTAEERMSGKTGTWRDIVKVDTTFSEAANVSKAAKEKGVNLSEKGMMALRNLANVDVNDLKDEEYLKAILPSDAIKAIEASGSSVGKYGKDLAHKLLSQGTMADASNAVQSKEFDELRKMITKKDYAGIQEKYKGKEQQLKDIIATGTSGMTANADKASVMGGRQFMINQMKQAGFDIFGGEPLQRNFVERDYVTAMNEGGAANTMFEKQRQAEAGISQDYLTDIMNVGRDKAGGNTMAMLMGDTRGMVRDVGRSVQSDVVANKTVEPPKDMTVVPITDALKEMMEGFKQIKEAFTKMGSEGLTVNNAKEVNISGPGTVKGVTLDNGLTAAAEKAGDTIAARVAQSLQPNAASAGKGPGPAPIGVSAPAPQGPQ